MLTYFLRSAKKAIEEQGGTVEEEYNLINGLG